MILDKLENASLYKGISRGIDKVLELAKSYTPENYPSERLVVDGDKIYLNFAAYETHSKDSAVAEAHRRYIDVMCMIEGSENIYVKPTDKLQNVTKEYDPEIEALLADVDNDTTAVRLNTGNFVVLFPQDAHAPACDPLPNSKVKVKKIIGKVLIED